MSRSKLKLNWKYALGEITLIFVGISLAVAFDNFNQELNKDQSQRLILEEIHTDLLEDTILINSSLAQTDRLMNGVDYLVDLLRKKEAFTDTTELVLAKVLMFPRISFISAGYQTLKSSDITLIENQALRRDLVEYYEYMHPKVVQQMGDVEFEFKTYWTPWILENIAEFRYAQIARPFDPNDLLNDQNLVRNFLISKDNNSGLHQGLLEAQEEVNSLIEAVEAELDKLN